MHLQDVNSPTKLMRLEGEGAVYVCSLKTKGYYV